LWIGLLMRKTYKVSLTPRNGGSISYKIVVKARNLDALKKKLTKMFGNLNEYRIEVFEREL